MNDTAAVELLARSLARLVAGERELHVRDIDAALTARDTVVVRLRALTGALLGAGPDTHQQFSVRHLATNPAHVLHAALHDLPLASGPDRPAIIDVLVRGGDGALPLWQDATRAAVALEPYAETLRRLPGPDAWLVARDLAHLAAALPHLDADLARTLPFDATHTSRALSDDATHTVIRLAADELAARIAPGPRRARDLPLGAPPRPIRVDVLAVLPEATARLAAMLDARGSALTATEARAVAKAMATGMETAARVLRATGSRNYQGADIAEALDGAVPPMRRIYLEPMETLTPPDRTLLYLTDAIRQQMDGAAALLHTPGKTGLGQEQRHDLAAAAVSMLNWVREVPRVAAALDAALHTVHQAGRLLSPAEDLGSLRTSRYLWVRAQTPTGDVEPLALGASAAASRATADAAAHLGGAKPTAGGDEATDASLAVLGAAVAARGRPPARAPVAAHPRTGLRSRHRIEPLANLQKEEGTRHGRGR